MDQDLKKILDFAYKTHLVFLVGLVFLFLSFLPTIGLLFSLVWFILVLIGIIMMLIYFYKFSKYFEDAKLFLLPLISFFMLIIVFFMLGILGISTFLSLENFMQEGQMNIYDFIGDVMIIIFFSLIIGLIAYILWGIAYFKLGKYLENMWVFWPYIIKVILNILSFFIPYIGILIPFIPQILWIYTFKKLRDSQ
ncbi:MAG TPA: hypothetical protein EYH54_01955 [Nautiliaceae bacterium]|nr:hypothetical protein [Nautiliaceae bacterium]